MMQCPVCRTDETTWKNVDHFRKKPEGMAMCETCGFISYPERYKTKAEIIEYYKKDYRQPPNIANLYTSERKIQYHSYFLEEIFQQWRDKDRKDPVVTDIGSAFGYFLQWVRRGFPEADIIGVELTQSFVRNAWHLYKIKTLDDFDDTKKYDLISSYKSLEHILDPDVELKRYIDALKEDGYLYLSVPVWFKSMKNFGVNSGFDIEYYYSPNHINTWTQKHVEGLIKACGGKIVKENHSYYEATYLIQRDPDFAIGDRTQCYESTTEIISHLEQIQKASEAYFERDFSGALQAWPNFPSAWAAYYENNRKEFDAQGFDAIYKEVCLQAISSCPEEADSHFLAADIAARYGRYDLSIEHLGKANSLRPNMPNFFISLANCYRMLAKHAKSEDERIKFLKESRKMAVALHSIGTQAQGEAMTWMMFDNARLPTPFEE